MKTFLVDRGFEFEERDVSTDKKAVFELVRTYHSRTTPTLVIGDEVIIGLDPKQLKEKLG